MIKLETRNGILVFVEVPENCHEYEYKEKESLIIGYYFGTPIRLLYSTRILPVCKNGYDILGEVTKEGIAFDCEPYLGKLRYDETEKEIQERFQTEMFLSFIELREGYKFIVLKEK